MSISNTSSNSPQPTASVTGSTAAIPPDESEIKTAIEVWKQIIAVQMHFNDIEMKIRTLYVSVLLATVAAIGWVVDKNLVLSVWHLEIHYAVFILAAGIISSYMFYLMDRYWYHQLLKGSVEQGHVLDNHYAAFIPALGLTSKISGASPIVSFRKTWMGRLLALLRIVSPPRSGEGKDDLHSTGKIELFYKSAIRLLSICLLVSLFAGGVTVSGDSLVKVIVNPLCNCFDPHFGASRLGGTQSSHILRIASS